MREVADNLAKFNVNMASLAVKIHDAEEFFNPNAVKVLTDKDIMCYIFPFGYSLRSRSVYEFTGCSESTARTLTYVIFGIYAYHCGVHKTICAMGSDSTLVNLGKLEQLRVLYNGRTHSR